MTDTETTDRKGCEKATEAEKQRAMLRMASRRKLMPEPKITSLTKRMVDAGFVIETRSYHDRAGTAHAVTVYKDGKQTMRRARGYEDALALCAEKRGML